MTDKLDSLLAQLREQPSDHPLVGLELRVQSRLRRREHWDVTLFMGPVRAAAVGLALMLGAGVGGLSAASAMAAPRPSLFAATDALAPSTLLDRAR
ncbi:MAG: hypothetical protein KAY22_02925 [Rhizorhabdus sp.]|jgi:hypothetical protein|uniref:hypothetical protein n=1 Tax=Rhizorhabdus sp. TaxID=1968843 RepID=UPI001B5D7591|nr:hypothetical protein [Rhizorhabdus sp.]MBP8231234.1 hypothetical protein [Rhizorhabdus sp.]